MRCDGTFCVLHAPWIPGRARDGGVTEHSLLDVLCQAHGVVGLSGDLPTQTFAVSRLLLAVLHGAIRGPKDIAEWEELWRAPALPTDAIEAYLAEHHERFDLLHPETPFLQTAELRTTKDETFALDRLIADVPNGVPFFATRRGELSLSYAEAARWLVHAQAFDPSGIKSGAVGDERVRNGKGYPIGVAWSGWLGGVLLEGKTLKETLLLNLLASDFGSTRDPEVDIPVWERPPLTVRDESGHVEQGREPTGPADLYTWPSRRIRLIAGGGRITRVIIANGNRLQPQHRVDLEPHTAWRRSPNQERQLKSMVPVYMPRAHDPDRAIWRGLESLLPAAVDRQTSGPADRIAPGVLDWLGHLCMQRALPRDFPVTIRAVGMIYGSQSSVVDDVVHDSLDLVVALARQDATGLVEMVKSCVRAADDAAFALGNLAGDLVAAAGGDGAGPRSRARERLYADLDGAFREWLTSVGADSDPVSSEIAWHRTADEVTRSAAADLMRTVSPAAWEGRIVRQQVLTAAHADNKFRRSLKKALPHAYATAPAVADPGAP
ncbi:type I-E CRISPR-associated protein Cse1/CasA [Pseudonocardia adelaidensis]|uniref:Type I-E CRISPR-associated protein Cse1/CasA n=1 Tax=Pseudonocardia adelaidensis TaxID=648754 RepID=A0ABP9NIN2_9PSEU